MEVAAVEVVETEVGAMAVAMEVVETEAETEAVAMAAAGTGAEAMVVVMAAVATGEARAAPREAKEVAEEVAVAAVGAGLQSGRCATHFWVFPRSSSLCLRTSSR